MKRVEGFSGRGFNSHRLHQWGAVTVSTGVWRFVDCAGIGAHRNENQTVTATTRDSKKSAKVLAFPARTEALQMAA
jgi:hypothetical protein